ncbi:MAG: N-6 DNA methylase [Thermodesulfovibrionales bacterium]
MSSAANLTELINAHKSALAGMMFYDSLASVLSDAGMLGYVSVVRRAWLEFKLDGMLCLDGRPVLYLKEYKQPPSSAERIYLQRLFWNQGVANILVLADLTSVYIYSGLAEPPGNKDNKEAIERALVEEVSLVDYIRQIQSFYHSLATGHYYEVHKDHFKPEQAVDIRLLENLRDLRNALIEGEERLEPKKAHAFLGRILFLCYLLDRSIISVGKPSHRQTGTMVLAENLNAQASHRERMSYLYDELFQDLKERFNGNMFDQDIDVEKHHIRRSHVDKLILFLGGHAVKSGQQEFGFWPYDFKMIPVETISAIYQDFLSTEDREAQEKRGAFYTPRFLAEMVVDMAVRDNPDALNWSYLDPACGSGIFLVILFNRLANHWIISQTHRPDYASQAKALKNILARQIRGVDIEETACRIACFSLYLAYLDFFDPPDIQSYMKKTGEKLPKLLDYGDTSVGAYADIPVIHLANFLDENTLNGETFDCIIGNPPWKGRQSKQLAQKFIERAPKFLRNDGTGCLLLPSKILQNQTDAFQSEWLKTVTLEKVLQLADYRFLLFQNALCPATITCFTNKSPNVTQHKIEFIAPKFNRDGLRQGIITINPSARAWIPLSDILAATRSKTASVVWKRHLWGTSRDQKLLDYLLSLPRLSNIAGKPEEGKRWIKGMGFQPYYPQKAKDNPDYPKPRPNPWNPDTPYALAGQNLNMILLSSECMPLGDRLQAIGASTKYLRRAPHESLFKAPLVLVSKGFGKVAYSDFGVLFEDALRSISGTEKDSKLLIFLSAYLRSKLASYCLFHTSANWGSERDQVHLSELLRVPFPLPDSEFVSQDGQKIIDQVARKFTILRDELTNSLKKFRTSTGRHSLFEEDETAIIKEWQEERRTIVVASQAEIEPLIYRYFGLTDQEIMLVEDTFQVFEPSSTPTTWSTPQTVTLDNINDTRVKPYAGHGLKVYADTLTSTLNKWAQAESSKYRVSAEGATDDKTGLAMITISISHSESGYKQTTFSQHLATVLKQFYRRAAKKQGTLLYERDIFFFRGNRIYIARPNTLLNWTRTAALNDAARIYGEIVMAGKRQNGK